MRFLANTIERNMSQIEARLKYNALFYVFSILEVTSVKQIGRCVPIYSQKPFMPLVIDIIVENRCNTF